MAQNLFRNGTAQPKNNCSWTLQELGWSPYFDQQWSLLSPAACVPARVAREDRERYVLLSEAGEFFAEVAGRFRHQADSRADFPAVGDWVAAQIRPAEGFAIIQHVLPRLSRFSRNVAGALVAEQIIAANIDTLFLVSGLDGNFKPRRIERYLVAARDSGAALVVLLNKSDLCPDAAAAADKVATIASGTPVHALSATTLQGLDSLNVYLAPGQTVALVGSSGVGKTTLANRLLGSEHLATAPVRENDSRGRHTTTRRQLVRLSSGAWLLDTPGMRELSLWDAGSGLGETFADVEDLAARCKFRNCAHDTEPNCAVRAALSDGTLDQAHFNNYIKLQREEIRSKHRQVQQTRQLEKKARKAVMNGRENREKEF